MRARGYEGTRRAPRVRGHEGTGYFLFVGCYHQIFWCQIWRHFIAFIRGTNQHLSGVVTSSYPGYVEGKWRGSDIIVKGK